MLEIYNNEMKRVAILENAYGEKEAIVLNGISQMTFSLPGEDPKNQHCKPFWFARYNGGALYRILPSARIDEEMSAYTYECEHVIATLLDSVMHGHHIIGNMGYYTDQCIRYILERQIKKQWELEQCDIRRQFEYGFEQENLLGALFSLPKPMSTSSMWEYNTDVYPWRLSLRALDVNKIPDLYVRQGKNMLSLRRNSDPKQICTRLYPLGYGEGINQLGIKEINGGLPYIQSPPAILAKYGIIERVWIDRRYEDQESLLSAAKAMLEELQEPITEYEVECAAIRAEDYNKIKVGNVVEVLGNDGVKHRTVITGVQWNYDELTSSKITIANKPKSIAQTVADLADRQRIEMTYSQGATQLYAQSLQANADSKDGAKLHFYIPEEMRVINKVQAKVRLEAFRSYSKATSTEESKVYSTTDGGASPQTTTSGGGGYTSAQSGGGSYTSTEAGGGGYTSAEAGGGSYTSTGAGGGGYTSAQSGGGAYTSTGIDSYTDNRLGGHNHGVPAGTILVDKDGRWHTWVQSGDHVHRLEITPHVHVVEIPVHEHAVQVLDHSHGVSIPVHTHVIRIYPHTHVVKIDGHTHGVNVPGHKHTTTIPGHGHTITPGIYRFGSSDSFNLYVNGSYKATFNSSDAELDLTGHLLDKGTIRRGQWQSVEIRPSDLAYVSIDIFVQGFVQSRGDQAV